MTKKFKVRDKRRNEMFDFVRIAYDRNGIRDIWGAIKKNTSQM